MAEEREPADTSPAAPLGGAEDLPDDVHDGDVGETAPAATPLAADPEE